MALRSARVLSPITYNNNVEGIDGGFVGCNGLRKHWYKAKRKSSTTPQRSTVTMRT